MKQYDFEEKLELIQSIEREAWGFYDLADLRELRTLIRERKRLANSYRYARSNAKTGQSAAAAKGKLDASTESFGVFEPGQNWEVEI